MKSNLIFFSLSIKLKHHSKMKNLILFTLFSLLTSGLSFAQEPEKDVKKADRLLGLYLLDTKGNKEKLEEAKKLIDGAYTNEAVAGMYKTWLVRGNIYNEVAGMENTKLVLNAKAKLDNPNAPVIALESLTKAMSLAVKGYEKKDVIASLQETSQFLNNFGSNAYNNNDFIGAYKNFGGVLKVDKLITEAGGKAILQSKDDVNRQTYITAICALSAKADDDALPYFEELAAANYTDSTGAGAVVYESLYKLYEKKDNAKAEKYLAEGRTKYPEETNLLFAEINHFLKLGKLDELIGKLKKAIEMEPNNLSIYNTLGNVYDNLCQKEWEKGDMVKADEYFNESLKNYAQVLAKDPNNGTALYSSGALYYNKAAIISKEANKLANDYTKDGTRKYNEKKAEMESYFDKALPYFERADAVDNKDVNTLIALKEIYAKKGNFEKSNAAKARLEALK